MRGLTHIRQQESRMSVVDGHKGHLGEKDVNPLGEGPVTGFTFGTLIERYSPFILVILGGVGLGQILFIRKLSFD